MSSRWRWVALAVVLLLTAGAGIGYVVAQRPARHPAPAAAPPPPRPAVLAALPSGAPVPVPADVARVVASALRDPAFGGHITGAIVDATTGTPLWDRSASTPMLPASTTKLLTAAAALTSLGPAATLPTDVVSTGDTLYLVGHGDVTLRARARPSYPPGGDVAVLARRTASALGATRSVRLCVDTTAWSGPVQAPGWNPGYVTGGDIAPLAPLEVDEGEAVAGKRPRVTDPAAQAATVFTADLRRLGVRVIGGPCRSAAPPSGRRIAEVTSAPVAALVQRMLTQSDNDLAESLGRAVAVHDGGPASFAGAAAAVTSRVRALGVDVTGLRLVDTSGLSRLDRVTPRTLVGLVRLAVSPAHPELRPVADGMPVAGLTGTLADRYRRAPAVVAAGVARAKTGTLLGVNTIAGTVLDAHDRLLAFAFMTDRASGPDQTEAALDRLVARLQRL